MELYKKPATINELAEKWWTDERLKKILGDKKYTITPKSAPQLLRLLGLLNADASMSPDNLKKFIQINHMFNLLETHFTDLVSRHKVVHILDVGCGKSYLTFLLAWCFKEKWNTQAKIVGVDTNQKIIKSCIEKAEKLGYNDFLSFECASMTAYKWPYENRPNAVVALHACDTATDMALAFAIKEKTDFIAVAPCCQAELARKWKEIEGEHPLNPVFHTPQIRRETAAHLTDSLRMTLTRASGYEVTATEFVPSNHTPKNRLLTCVRRGNYLESAKKEYQSMKEYLGGKSIMLEDLLNTN
ncbi:SAM-dependent methyltransferase [Pigmentibacter sp. JX0631]|uniref:class I SAM-dependent methyltransferase n=1 Tax=Pigmentibacter sp. JX0631 TaxID=2976982 RepID=UPI0024699834|nr:SAM-dependent methyltransferase [Pigmentibacter sp. JX0631]WGL61084.1 SAM-dependent methyltransferase [Pigmentibacter sp. JX0631]